MVFTVVLASVNQDIKAARFYVQIANAQYLLTYIYLGKWLLLGNLNF